jgi:hypothetical protein
MSLLLQGSLDGESWTDLGRQIVHEIELDPPIATGELRFAVARPMECRFIRLTMTDKGEEYRRLPNWDFDIGEVPERKGSYDLRNDRDVAEFERAQCLDIARLCLQLDFYICFGELEVEFFGRLSE